MDEKRNLSFKYLFFKRTAVLAFLLLCIAGGILVLPHMQKIYEMWVKQPDWANVGTEILSDEVYVDADLLIDVMKQNVKYICNTWWNEERIYSFSSSNITSYEGLTEEQKTEILSSQQSFMNWKSCDYLIIANSQANTYSENAIRPLAHACYVLSIALKFHIYDSSIAQVSENDAVGMTAKLIFSLARTHFSNVDNGWGGSWQSALWAENIGFAAWIMWDDLDYTTKQYVVNMVISEANLKSIDYEVPYYRDLAGDIVYPGDSKAEENAWNSRILALAVCMFPNHSNHDIWESKLYELLLSATACPDDAYSDTRVDGIQLSTLLRGSNINSDGTVINHDRYHIDYMVSPNEGMSETIIIYTLAGKEFPKAALFNQDIIYNALVNLDLGIYDESKSGHHFYERSSTGSASFKVNMPGDNDWSEQNCRVANYFLMDTAADLFGYDSTCPDNLKANDWAHVRLLRMQEMIERTNDGEITGQFYADGEENFASAETFAMSCLSQAYLLRALIR